MLRHIGSPAVSCPRFNYKKNKGSLLPSEALPCLIIAFMSAEASREVGVSQALKANKVPSISQTLGCLVRSLHSGDCLFWGKGERIPLERGYVPVPSQKGIVARLGGATSCPRLKHIYIYLILDIYHTIQTLF